MFKIKIHYIFFSILFICFLLFSNNIFASNIDGSIDSNFKNAFGENLGWLNFGCDNCNVHITDTNITGYIWSKTHGWINLSPSGSGVTNNCSGVLGGKAWSKSLGWLDFSGASIDESGKFIGVTDGLGTKAGRINFSCNNCGVSTDWRQCSLRESPAQVIINSITDNTVPTIGANISVKNEGNINTEYFLEWCVVSDISNACGGGDDIYYSSESKRILPGETWTDNKVATVLNTGDYYFKLVAHYGEGYSPASIPFTAIYQHIDGGGGGGGGGSSSSTPSSDIVINDILKNNYLSADFNRDNKVDSIDFSILLYFWKKSPPFKNIHVDVNKDGKVNSIDFSILLSQWGKKTI